MKSLAGPCICLVMSGAVLAGGYGFASYAVLDGEPHHFANLDAPLWTTTPTRVDPSAQNYERLPPLPRDSNSAPAVRLGNLVGVGAIAPPEATATTTVELPKQEWMADSRHLGICQQRYRSYTVADNTYQPLDGGPRKPCVIEERKPSAGMPAAATGSDPHISWCAARYGSYRASDNTYQPFSGPRRQCASPVA